VTVCASHHRTRNVVTLATGTLNLQVRRQEWPDKPSNLSATEAFDSSFVNITPLKRMDCLSFTVDYLTYFSVLNSKQNFELECYFLIMISGSLPSRHGTSSVMVGGTALNMKGS
jgi:hypothetical protein